MSESIIVLGAGGHAKVITDIILSSNDKVIGFLDDNKKSNTFLNLPILGPICNIENISKKYKFIIGIGSNALRKQIDAQYSVTWYTGIHPTAIIGSQVIIGEGSIIMPNVVINADTKIGKHCIINTSAIVEHDNMIGNYVHISPNAVLGGGTSISNGTHIGIGVVVKNNVSITNNCVIGAGAVVTKDLNISGTYVGIPARRIG